MAEDQQSLPSTMKAVKITALKQASVVSDAPIPSCRPDYILVRTAAVALNPTDWKHLDFLDPYKYCSSTPTSKPLPPSKCPTLGCDYSGRVHAVGSSVTMPWKAGQRVCGVVHGANEVQPEDGAFGEYLVAKGDLQMAVPEAWSDEEAAAIGMGVSTVGQGLFQSLELPLPKVGKQEQTAETGEKIKVLIYGGSSAMGAYGIQFAKSAGLEIYTTCSPHNFDYVRSLGATHVYDYSQLSVCETIRKDSSDSIYYAWDCIATQTSTQICSDALSSSSTSSQTPKYSNILRQTSPRKDVQSLKTLMYSTFGEEWTMAGTKMEKRVKDFEWMREFVKLAQKLIDEGQIKPHRIEKREGGLQGIVKGLEDMKNGKVSAAKLVYKL